MADYAPLRAEPGQEFSFTRQPYYRPLRDDDDVDALREAGRSVRAIDEDGGQEVLVEGEQATIRADREGIVRATDDEQDRVLRSFGLPVARKIERAEKAAEKGDE